MTEFSLLSLTYFQKLFSMAPHPMSLDAQQHFKQESSTQVWMPSWHSQTETCHCPAMSNSPSLTTAPLSQIPIALRDKNSQTRIPRPRTKLGRLTAHDWLPAARYCAVNLIAAQRLA